ncbi:MAG TPA: penicillin-binding protein 2 [Acidimicrobiales bacterium]|nr:penicillin-binding protein 2 [Acidimicrobiales bacterium]
MNRQIRRLGIALLVAFGALFLQLNYVQVVEAHKLANAPGNTRTATESFSRPRGVIQTSDGVVVARSVPSNDSYKYQRQYPTGPLFAHVTGYVSFIYGEEGVEQVYDPYLAGKKLPIRHLSDLLTNRVATDDVTLTLNDKLQQAAQGALGNKLGSVIALNPTDGAILAMWSNPSYDPNPLASHDLTVVHSAWTAATSNPLNPMLPRAYRRSYPPGSTFKVVTSAAVFDHNPSLANKSYPVLGSLTLPFTHNTLNNFQHETCGGPLPELLKVSCDTGFGQVGLDLGGDSLSSEASSFGFNSTPPLDLPSPAKSKFPPGSFFKQNLPLLAYSAIGQDDVSATTLQMALVGAAIANGGTIMKPHVMSEIRDSQGNVVSRYKPAVWMQATSSQTADQVRSMMMLVVQPGGTAPDLNLPGVQVAAKTGTAQTGLGTTDDWMIAFAPAQSPKVVVAVSVPNQPQSATGDAVSGPIVRSMLLASLLMPGPLP